MHVCTSVWLWLGVQMESIELRDGRRREAEHPLPVAATVPQHAAQLAQRRSTDARSHLELRLEIGRRSALATKLRLLHVLRTVGAFYRIV